MDADTTIIGARVPTGIKDYLEKNTNRSKLIQTFLFDYIEEKEGKDFLEELCGNTKMYRDYKFYKG